jgi:Integral peroxisomal membrane peroxin
MSVFDYVDIPPYATVVTTEESTSTKVNSSLPPSSNAPDDSATSSVPGNTPTPTRTVFGNLPGIILASSLQIPTNVPNANPRNVSQLVSSRDPLSVPTTTVNFRRFISRIGPVFWLQDRIEEIVTWKKGWKVTVLWMMVYSFICQSGLLSLVNDELIFL